MSVEVDIEYMGRLRCRAVHAPSADAVLTDAPADHHGAGEHFSPTDLLGTALGSCMLTTMGIWAARHNVALPAARARVVKHMGAAPRRHIARLEVRITVPASVAAEHRAGLERAARGCPVSASLSPDTAVELAIDYL